MASSPDAASGAGTRILAGRIAVVTGATGGIGRAIAERLSASGARVVLLARTRSAVEAAAAAVGGIAVAGDVATEEGIEATARAIAGLSAADGPDIVVHAAGAFELAPLAQTSVEMFDRTIAVNLRAAFLLVRRFVPRMLERGSGHIVTIGSVAGRTAFPANGAYSASKFGVRGMHAVLAAELRGTGVRASFIEPAATDTPLWDAVDRSRNPGLPLRSAMLAANAVADAVLYTVSRPDDVLIPNILVERA
jgi:NAD(P)-dependent dehydrogenase (short-subunit alcohol dehydrogenase family)